MAVKKYCEKLKDLLESLNFIFKRFDESFGRFQKDKSADPQKPNPWLSMQSYKSTKNVIKNRLDESMTNAPSGQTFTMKLEAMTDHLEVNVRKQLEVAPGIFVRIGDILEGDPITKRPKCTVIGFEVKTDHIIGSYESSSMRGLRKKIEYMPLHKDAFINP